MTTPNKGQIYCIKNTVNDKKYVGQTLLYRKAGKYMRKFGYECRFLEHKNYADRKKASLLGRAMIELGKEKFFVELLEECEIECLDERERYWIDALGTLTPNGYNALYGAPYSHNEEAKQKISEGMKAFFKDQHVRKAYSDSHINKFKDIRTECIQSISIRPIKQAGMPRIVYMYVAYEDQSQVRRRYGGIYETFENAYERCYNDAKDLLQGDTKRIITTDRISPQINDVTLIEMKLHKMRDIKLVSVYITTSECASAKEKKRYVFGGKTITLHEAYNRATEFVNKTKTTTTRVYIQESLVAATLSN